MFYAEWIKSVNIPANREFQPDTDVEYEGQFMEDEKAAVELACAKSDKAPEQWARVRRCEWNKYYKCWEPGRDDSDLVYIQ